MVLGHERLDVYRLAIGYVAWVCGKEPAPTANARQKLIPIPIAIAIGMKRSPNHRRVATGNPRHTRNVACPVPDGRR